MAFSTSVHPPDAAVVMSDVLPAGANPVETLHATSAPPGHHDTAAEHDLRLIRCVCVTCIRGLHHLVIRSSNDCEIALV